MTQKVGGVDNNSWVGAIVDFDVGMVGGDYDAKEVEVECEAFDARARGGANDVKAKGVTNITKVGDVDTNAWEEKEAKGGMF